MSAWAVMESLVALVAIAITLDGSLAEISDAIQQSAPAVVSGQVRKEATPSKHATPAGEPRKELFTGQVVLLPDALHRRGIQSTDEAKGQVVLETSDAELIPLVPDWRGRALFQDKRLRDRRIELVGSRRKGVPYLQVLMIFVFDEKGTRQYVDYWCDICSIPMYEIKPCDCCQDDVRLRLQPHELPDFIKKPSL